MKRNLLTSIAVAIALAALPSARAATDTWIGATGLDWETGTNWSTLAKPGAADTALFNTALGSVTNSSANQTVGSISFDTLAGTASGAFTLGTVGGNSLILGNTGTIQIFSTLLGTGKSLSIDSPIVLTPASTTTAGSYTFANYSIAPTNTLNFGGAISASLTSNTETLTLNGTNTGSNTISGVISNGSATTFALTKTGTGTWILSGANTYNGATTISAGTLKLGNATALGTGTASVTSGAALDLYGTTMTGTNGLTLNGTGVNGSGALMNSSATAGTYAGLIALGSASSIIAGSGNITLSNTNTISGAYGLTLGGAYNGSIASIIGTGAGTLTKQDGGTWTLTRANTYTGATTINVGVLNIQNATALGTIAAGTTVAAGGALQIKGGITVGAEALTINGAGINNDGALRNISDANVWQGTVTLASAARINSDSGSLTFNTAANSITGAFNLTLGGAGNGTVGGTITTGAGTLTKDGAGTWTLSGANTYTGTTFVNGGLLQLNVAEIANTSGPLGKQLATAANTIVLQGGGLQFTSNNTNDYSGRLQLADGFTGTCLLYTSDAADE